MHRVRGRIGGGKKMRKTKGISRIITHHYNMSIDEVVKVTKQKMLSTLMGEVINEIGFDIEAKIKVHYYVTYLFLVGFKTPQFYCGGLNLARLKIPIN